MQNQDSVAASATTGEVRQKHNHTQVRQKHNHTQERIRRLKRQYKNYICETCEKEVGKHTLKELLVCNQD